MDWLEFFDLVVPGFVACAEFGFFLFMRPRIRLLSERDHVKLEQRFLQTFNRIFPILTGLSVLLILVYALRFKENSVANRAVWGAPVFLLGGNGVLDLVEPVHSAGDHQLGS